MNTAAEEEAKKIAEDWTHTLLELTRQGKVLKREAYYDLTEHGHNVLAELDAFIDVSPDGKEHVNQSAVAEFLEEKLKPTISEGVLTLNVNGEEIKDEPPYPFLNTAIRNFVPPCNRKGQYEKGIRDLFLSRIIPDKRVNPLKLNKGKELLKKELPNLFFPVEGLVSEGLTYIAAAPKIGKSWLVMDMCLSVAEGKPFLGMETNRCDTLYLALEDGERLFQQRLEMVLKGSSCPEGFFYILSGVRRLSDGFLDQLDGIIAENPEIRLIVIDTKVKIEYLPKRGTTQYQIDYETGGALKAWADAHHIAIVCVTHTIKAKHEDVFNNMTGSIGTLASTDCTIIIQRDRGDENATFIVTSRNAKEMKRNIRFDSHNCKWVDLGDAAGDNTDREKAKRLEKYLESPIREAILKLCDAKPEGWRGRCGELIQAAAQIGIGITEPAKGVGVFVNENTGYFIKNDRIQVTIHPNGEGSKTYAFKVWHDADEKSY